MAERYQMHNDMPVHKFIPMEKFDLIQPNEVRILYYQNPSRFYVYLRQRINSHAQFQVELQRAMGNYQTISTPPSYQRSQPVVAQDNHAIWHRATILDFNSDPTEVHVYFVDVGQEETISITNIRPLPAEFIRQPAFAIPCRLYGIFPLHGNEQSSWKLNDPVHDQFNRLMANNASCKVCKIKEQICYDVDIDIPEVGDLGTYLFEEKLVSRINMRTATPQSSPQSFGGIPPGFSGVQPQPITRLLQKPIVQQSPATPTSNDSSSDISTLPPQDGNYIITHVYSAVEFYGHSQVREKELDAFHKHLETIYNNNTNDQSLSVHFLMEGVPCVIQQGEKYHRVIIKHRESESRVLVKLIDRGDEILVDTSELLQLEQRYFTIPAFAQPFRLYNYDETHSTANITRKLKRLILNQRVYITQHLPMINKFYPVEVKLSDNQSVNQILLSNDPLPIIPPPVKPIELPPTKPQRINEDLPAPQKLLTAPSTNRFTANEPSSRFSRPTQQQEEESKPPVNGVQSLMTEPNRTSSRGFSTERNDRGGRNNDDNENRRGLNNRSEFADRNTDENENRRGFNNRGGGGFGDRGNRNGFGDRNNYEDRNENNGQQTGGFNSNRGGGARNGDFQDRNNRFRNNQEEDNNENNGAQRFPNRSGFNGERRDRNGDGGGFQSHRDREDGGDGGDNRRRGGFGDRGGSREGRGGYSDRGNRGGYSDRGNRGGYGDRGNRGGYSDRGNRGGYSDRDNRGGYGDRGSRGGYGDRGGGRPGGFGDRNENGFRSTSDDNEPMKTFSGWPNIKPTPSLFEAGDNYIENEIPKGTFQFVISHIEKANDFFIQLTSKENELSELTDTLQKESKDAPELTFNSIKPKQACLAKSSDGCWYRAIILSPGLIKIKIRFIDFGDTIDADAKTIRQLAKKFSSKPPYAYHCTLKNVTTIENINTIEIITKCADQKFDGKIDTKSSDDEKYFLQSDNFQKLLIDIHAIKANLPCLIVYVDHDKNQFYIQDDPITMEKIKDEVTTDTDLSPEEIHVNAMVISTFEDEPYRAIIQSDLEEDVKVYFVDYGNTNICSKISLKKCSDQLKSYPYQAKRCQLSDISFNDSDQISQKLDEINDSIKTEISIINKTDDDLYYVRLYVNDECFNEQFSNDISIDLDDQSSTTTATTVKEQERPISATGKRNNEEILSPVGNLASASMNIKRQKSESETDVNSTKSHQGVLTYIDKTKPFIYLQLIPESISIIERINILIDAIVDKNQHNSSYEIGDYVIAQFTDDDSHYRARIESYSSSTEFYTVYFLDYGNTDENVSKERLYSYSTELEQIEFQAHRYALENQLSQTWLNTIQPLMEKKLNEEIEFYFIDEINSIIHLKLENENEIYHQGKTLTANISGTNQDCFYIHILPESDTLICEMDELLQQHPKEHHQENLWKINDLCIVFDTEQNQYFRGKILSINDEKYRVQCIDYGNVLSNITHDNLYLLTDKDLIKRNPLARQCRLQGVDDKNQFKAIEEIIKNIDQNERVTITVENDQNNQCMFVMLFRANDEIVNDRYVKQEIDIDTKTAMSTNSSDSAIAADDDTSNDQQVTSPIGVPQAESTHQYGDTTNLTVSIINQTIDFGENDPSSSNTTLRYETETEN